MMSKSHTLLLAIILALAGTAIALIAWDVRLARHDEQRSRDFQQLVRGLGLGATLTLSRCEFSFDPRVFPDWRSAHFPLVCSEYYCPLHTGSVFYLRPVPPSATASRRNTVGVERSAQEARDASIP